MRRKIGAMVAVAAVVAAVASGCAASGSSASDDDVTSSTTAAERSSTTAPDGPDPTSTSTTGATPAPGELATWDDVVDVASADHGTVVRHVNATDGDGEPIIPDMGIEMAFDADQQVLQATIEVPPMDGEPGGTVQYIYAPDRTLMAVDSITGACSSKWLSMDEVMAGVGDETGMDLTGGAQVPMPPFDLVLDHAPVAPEPGDGVTVFPFEIPASLLVSAKLQLADPEHWADLEALAVPAELRLHPDGTLELDAAVPLGDVMPPSQLQTMPDGAERYEMVGSWTLEASEEPLGLSVPNDYVTMDDDCVSGN